MMTTATGQLMSLPLLAPLRWQAPGFDLARQRESQWTWSHRILRAPEPDYPESATYGPDGRVDLSGATGRMIDLFV